MLIGAHVQVAARAVQHRRGWTAEGRWPISVSSDAAEFTHDLHETFFDVLLILIGLHVAAILFYRLSRQETRRADGHRRARVDPRREPMRPGKWWVALLCLLALAITRWIVAGAPPFGA